MSRKDESRQAAGPIDTEERHAVPSPARGNTASAQGETQQPRARLPHERDESADSQSPDTPGARRKGKMAYDDLMEGQQDTSKSQEMDATYHAVRQGSEPAPTDKPDRDQRGN